MVIHMVIQGDILTLSKEEISKLIEAECRKRLGISIEEFRQLREENKLPDTVAVRDIEMLLKLV